MLHTQRFAQRQFAILLTVCAGLVLAAHAFPADWPMWRHDASRTAATTEKLADDLHLQWVHEYPQLQPAWPDEPRMTFDVAIQPVVSGRTMYIASPRTDTVKAVDTRSGAQNWRFYADGPVRFAPVVSGGRLYFTSDDGCLYCLNAENGALLWRFNGAPRSRKVIGNKRLISSWPARGAPVVADGTVYFAAGIWPFMGVFVYAIDADTGEKLWVNDGSGSNFISQPHGGAYAFGGIAPQGYIAVEDERLVVPNGRSTPAVFDRSTGKLLYFHLAENKSRGNYAVSAAEKVYFNSGRAYDLRTGGASTQLPRHPVIEDGVVYAVGDEKAIVAYNADNGVVKTYSDDDGNQRRRLKIDKLWQSGAKADRLWLKADDKIIASAGNAIMAFDLKGGGVKAEPSWGVELDTPPAGAVAADDRLFVTTLGGRICCFGAEDIKRGRMRQRRRQIDGGAGAAHYAKRILQATDVTEGYCLCMGVGDGDLMAELARQSSLHIIGIDPRNEKIDALRRRFDRAGVYGNRIALLAGRPRQLGLPSYMARLIVSGELSRIGGKSDTAFVKTVFQSLRPYGGTVCFGLSRQRHVDFAAAVSAAELPRARCKRDGRLTLLQRTGPLSGSDNWTHQYGNIANTVSSTDARVRAPLGLLWFGGSSNETVLPRHGHGPPEQVIGGRLFIEGPNGLRAMDVYTGRVLWRRKLPGFGRPYDYTGHQPGANAIGTNYVAARDAVYAAWNQRCLKLDPATGETMRKITLAPEAGQSEPQQWGYIGVYDDLLIAGANPVIFNGEKPPGRDNNPDATSSSSIVVMDRQTGEEKWRRQADYCFRHNAICAGDGVLFCIDRLPDPIIARRKRRGEDANEQPRLYALDIRSGDEIWSTEKDVFGTFLSYSADHDILLQAGRPSRDMLPHEPGNRMIAYRAADGSIVWDRSHKYTGPPLLHDDTIITQGQAFSLLTGDRKTRRNPITGQKMPWAFRRFYGCNTAIASEHLLTFRSGAAGYCDLAYDSGTGNIGGFKSGCTSNLVVANGVLNAPDYTRTCTCSYQNQTSLALVHDPAVEMWTFNDFELGDARIRRLGLNCGAPGDRRADDNGTLWLEYPAVGGPSPKLPVTIAGQELRSFRRHPSAVTADKYAWVAASGIEGLRKVTVTVDEQADEPRPYIVTLYFAEPQKLDTGDRVFDVSLQGKPVMEEFDITAAAGGRRLITRRFEAVAVRDKLTLEFAPADADTSREPILCGIEVIAR